MSVPPGVDRRLALRALVVGAAVFLVSLPAFAAAAAAFGDDTGNPAGAVDVFGDGEVPASRLVLTSPPLARRLDPSADPARETFRARTGEALRAPPAL